MAKITKRTVDALAGQKRERVVWDDDLKGFGVRVHPSGRRVYIVKTRYRGRVIKMTIGPSWRRYPLLCPRARRRDHHRREGGKESYRTQCRRADHDRAGGNGS